MSSEYDAAMEVCGALEQVRQELDFIGQTLIYAANPRSRRERIATAALQSLVGASYGEEGYVPSLADGDFTPNESGSWYCSRHGWTCEYIPPGSKLFSLTASMEQRFARDAVSYADALIAELDKEAEPAKSEVL